MLKTLQVLRDRSFFFDVGGGWKDLGGHAEKKAFEGELPKKIIEKGNHVKYFSKTLKWYNVLQNEVREF